MNSYYKKRQSESGFEGNVMFWCCVGIIIILLMAALTQGAEVKTYTANVSGYCLCEKCCGKWAKVYPRRTASGHIIKAGDKFVAAPKDIPFGTWITIPGYGRVRVEDRGGAIKDNRLDLFFSSHSEALKWGRQYLKVKVELK
jgi:3D (Asp-Asp-Asp) domain-containing protein